MSEVPQYYIRESVHRFMYFWVRKGYWVNELQCHVLDVY
jgi:hypothetical protein